MNNFPIEKDGKTYWVSRSIAVIGLVLTKSNNKWYFLANKRGEGCPDFNGCWNIPCGYLDYNETAEEAVAREVFEECGIRFDPSQFTAFYINSDPRESNRQNVTIRYIAFVDQSYMHIKTTDRFSEKNEVEEIRWIPLTDVDNYEWAFEHEKILKGKLVRDLIGDIGM